MKAIFRSFSQDTLCVLRSAGLVSAKLGNDVGVQWINVKTQIHNSFCNRVLLISVSFE